MRRRATEAGGAFGGEEEGGGEREREREEIPACRVVVAAPIPIQTALTLLPDMHLVLY